MPERSPCMICIFSFLLFKRSWHVHIILIVNRAVIHEMNLLKRWLSHPIEGPSWGLTTPFITEQGQVGLSCEQALTPAVRASWWFHCRPPCPTFLRALKVSLQPDDSLLSCVSSCLNPGFQMEFTYFVPNVQMLCSASHSSSRPVDIS